MEITRENAKQIEYYLCGIEQYARLYWWDAAGDNEDTRAGFTGGAGVQANELYRDTVLELWGAPELPDIKEHIEGIFYALDTGLQGRYGQCMDYENENYNSEINAYCSICNWVEDNLLTRTGTMDDITNIFFSDTPCESLQDGYKQLEKLGEKA